MCIRKLEFWVSVRKGKILGPNSTPARFISTCIYIGKWELQVSVRKWKILGPNTLARFISTRMYIGKWELQVSVRKWKILGPNTPARFISTHMYIGKWESNIFVTVFTNFAATLARQPSAASLAPRLKNSNSNLRMAWKYCTWCLLIFELWALKSVSLKVGHPLMLKVELFLSSNK